MTPGITTRILLVDDFEPWRHELRSLLQSRAGLQIVGEARDGREGIEKAQQLRADLVLLDIGLPDLNGIEVAERVYQVSPESKILFITSNNDASLANAMIARNGVHGYLLKSEIQEELFAAITAVLGGKQFISKRLLR